MGNEFDGGYATSKIERLIYLAENSNSIGPKWANDSVRVRLNLYEFTLFFRSECKRIIFQRLYLPISYFLRSSINLPPIFSPNERLNFVQILRNMFLRKT